ncbi:MAG: hypothetical protein M1819_005098 [Sarea resinae]|nr:MAG: hypothetical protein M1819_005098 [Sarea resinae]
MSAIDEQDVRLPVIDISTPDARAGNEIVDAASKYGFLFIKAQGSGFSQNDIDRMFELSRQFFSSSREEKDKCAITPDNRGWSSMHREVLDQGNQRKGDFKEAFNFGEFVNGKAQQPLPEALERHEEELNYFSNLCHGLCIKILKLFALGLKIEPEDGGQDWFSSRHDPTKGPSGSILRLLHYPAIPEGADYVPNVDIRAGAHSDYGSITLLFQRLGQPGLEILTAANTWSAVPVNPAGTESDSVPPIVINIGDLLSYWTDGLLRSTVHRVIFPSDGRKGGEYRQSIAYFCHPVNDSPLIPVPSPVVRARAKANGSHESERVLTAEEHLKSRLAATYGWSNDEKATA